MTPRTPAIVLPQVCDPWTFSLQMLLGDWPSRGLLNAVRNVRGMNSFPHEAKLCGRSARTAATTGDCRQSSGTAAV